MVFVNYQQDFFYLGLIYTYNCLRVKFEVYNLKKLRFLLFPNLQLSLSCKDKDTHLWNSFKLLKMWCFVLISHLLTYLKFRKDLPLKISKSDKGKRWILCCMKTHDLGKNPRILQIVRYKTSCDEKNIICELDQGDHGNRTYSVVGHKLLG